MSQFDATRRGSSCLKCVKIRRRLGLHPSPHWGSSQRSPDPIAAFKGREEWMEGEGNEGEGSGRRGGKERGIEEILTEFHCIIRNFCLKQF